MVKTTIRKYKSQIPIDLIKNSLKYMKVFALLYNTFGFVYVPKLNKISVLNYNTQMKANLYNKHTYGCHM